MTNRADLRKPRGRISRTCLVMLVGSAVCVALLVLGWYWATRMPVSKEAFEALEYGMTKDEVISLLGNPTDQFVDGRFWKYTAPMDYPSVKLGFNENDELVEKSIERFW